MARGPDGSVAGSVDCADLSAEDRAFVLGLEGTIDRALQRLRPGERFVYGIHQELPDPIARCLIARYRAAGWTDVQVLPGATGAAMLVLAP